MALFRRVVNLFRRSILDSDIADEIQSHIDLRIEANLAAGMSPQEARREAMLRFGNPVSTKERTLASDTTLGLAGLGRDLRYALRRLRRSRGFATTAILTLAVGIGANVIVFGVVNALILRPLNVANPDRLVQIVQQPGYDSQSYPDYIDLASRNSTFSSLATYRIAEAGLSSQASAQRVWAYEVSANYFEMLGVQPRLGRLLQTSDDRGPDSAPYIVISENFWRTRFNGDPDVVGSTINLNKHPFTIIGVAPRTFHGTELFFWPDLWLPIINEQLIEGYDFLHKRYNHGILVIGSLKPGVTRAQATENLNSIAHQLGHEHPVEDEGMQIRLVKPGLMGDTLGSPARAFMGAVLGLTLLVLFAACVNLAGIFIARSKERSREIAIRLSIGSSRMRIIRQLLTEATVISLAGGAAGTVLALALLNVLTQWQPISEFPIHINVAADSRVFATAFLLSIASGILPGLLPARQVWRTDPMQAIKTGAASGRMPKFTLRDALLAIQVAVCGLLVTASFVSLRGMLRSLHAHVGFDPHGVTLADTDMKMAGYSDSTAFQVQRRMLSQIASLPGVTAVGTIDQCPLSSGNSSEPIFREGTTDFRGANAALVPKYFEVSPGYLHAAGTRLLAGRDFTWSDDEKSPRVAIVNQTFARIMFGNSNAIGRRFVEPSRTVDEIVGIVQDGKYDSLTEQPQPAIFYSLPQNKEGITTLVVRSSL